MTRVPHTGFLAVLRRDGAAFFTTPIALVFLLAFLAASGVCTLYLANWFDAGDAHLGAFFAFHPWLYLFFAPAIAMRSWAEEHRAGTIELLLTFPIRLSALVLGKFFATWLFCALALALTCPLWLTADYLGAPDHGVILAGYIGSWLMAGAYLAISACMSAATRNQVIAFIASITICFVFSLSGLLPGFRVCEIPADTPCGCACLIQFHRAFSGDYERRV